ncbi:MAG: energy-coupling factor transporter transmembrane protein EcfT, partial [Evtepia sp.]
MFGQNWGDITQYHPLVHALYFILVITSAMCLMSPIYLCISCLSALLCASRLTQIRARYFFILLPAALINPAFNHRGATILCYLPSGNPLTLESILYGLATAAM